MEEKRHVFRILPKKKGQTGLERRYTNNDSFHIWVKYSLKTACVVQTIYDLSEECDKESDSLLSYVRAAS